MTFLCSWGTEGEKEMSEETEGGSDDMGEYEEEEREG